MYAIFFEIDKGEWDYVRQGKTDDKNWENSDPVRVFGSVEEARKVASTYNTATVCKYPHKQAPNVERI